MYDHSGRIEELLHPQTVAGGTGAGRVVEREQARLQLRQRVAALGAGEAGREQLLLLLSVHEDDACHAVGEIECGLE